MARHTKPHEPLLWTGTPADWAPWFSTLHAARASVLPELDAIERLERARAFIDSCFDQPIDLDVIARQACFSRYHFVRQFRRTFQTTPHQYLTELRIERAKALLQTTDRSVTEICFDVGYQSLGSFSSLFSRHVGHSPHRYRAHIFVSPGIPVTAIPSCFWMAFGGRPARAH